MKEQLELKHIEHYALKGVWFMNEGKRLKCKGVYSIKGYWYLKATGGVYDISECKLILQPLSDLTKEHLSILFGYETEDDIVDFEIITTPYGDYDYIEYELFGVGHISKCIAGYNELQKLFSEHWDLFGLIEKGLAYDINKLEENVN